MAEVNLDSKVARRVKRADYSQGRHGICLICNRDWDSCPHDVNEINTVIRLVRDAEITKKYLQ